MHLLKVSLAILAGTMAVSGHAQTGTQSTNGEEQWIRIPIQEATSNQAPDAYLKVPAGSGSFMAPLPQCGGWLLVTKTGNKLHSAYPIATQCENVSLSYERNREWVKFYSVNTRVYTGGTLEPETRRNSASLRSLQNHETLDQGLRYSTAIPRLETYDWKRFPVLRVTVWSSAILMRENKFVKNSQGQLELVILESTRSARTDNIELELDPVAGVQQISAR